MKYKILWIILWLILTTIIVINIYFGVKAYKKLTYISEQFELLELNCKE